MSSKSISVKSLLQEHEFHDHVNSYFLHASKLSDSCYKLFHGFLRLYVNFLGDSLCILEIRTVTLADDVIQYSMSFENNPKSKKKQQSKKAYNAKISKGSSFIPNYQLKQQYLLEISCIKMIPTISSIHQYKNSSLKTTIK